MKAFKAAALVSIVTGMSSSPAHAETARSEITIRGVVPTICRVDFGQSAPRAEGRTIDFGLTREFCNQGGGYRLVLRHPAGMLNASVSVGGATVVLSPGTETVILDVSGPEITSRSVTLRTGNSSIALESVSFRVEPKGAIY